MTRQDRFGNRYLVNFIDHMANYCRVFLPRSNDAAAKEFKVVFVHCEKLFVFKFYVLRTDSSGEYANADLFSKRTVVALSVVSAQPSIERQGGEDALDGAKPDVQHDCVRAVFAVLERRGAI